MTSKAPAPRSRILGTGRHVPSHVVTTAEIAARVATTDGWIRQHTGIERRHVAPAGDQVFVTYEAQNINGKKFRNTEILTIRDGRIVAAEVYFGWTIPHGAAAGGFVDPGKA